MKFNEINIRDPFILADNGKYYLYGSRGNETWGECTGFDVYVSEDLSEWSEPIEAFTKPSDFWADRNFWAPEVHKYKGSYYMFASFKSEDRARGTQILKATSPTGPFTLHSDGPVTPSDWECLDGTLYIENDIPYIVFCHEWLQITDGEMCVLQLTDDLKAVVGEPRVLFRASEPAWAHPVEAGSIKGYVTDGPYFYRCADNRLIMIWSSFDKNGYVEAVAVSDNGSINGNWKPCDKLFSSDNGGHGMIFKDFSGKVYFTMHTPNEPKYAERPALFEVEEVAAEPYIKMK